MFNSTGSLINSTETDISEYLICLKNDEVEINFYGQFPQQDFLDFEIINFFKIIMMFFLSNDIMHTCMYIFLILETFTFSFRYI